MSAIVAFPKPEVRMAWHCRGADEDLTANVGGSCAYCARDIACAATDKRPVCTYCALERGIIEEVEIEPSWFRSATPSPSKEGDNG